MAVLSTYIAMITLNVNRLNSPIKRTKVVEWIKKKKRPKNMLSTGDLF